MPPLRVLVVDDHAALRSGLEGLLDGEPDLTCVATAAGVEELDALLDRSRPDVVVLDYAMGADDGLSACFRVKQRPSPPAVVLYSAYVDDVFAVPAAMAQADALVSKSAPAGELLDAIRRAGRGWTARPVVDAEVLAAASSRLRAEDLPIASMLSAATPVGEIAEVLDLPAPEVRERALRIMSSLRVRQMWGMVPMDAGRPRVEHEVHDH